MVKPAAPGCVEQSHHGRDDPAVLDQLNLLVKDRRRVMVETHDESAVDLQPEALNLLDASHQVAAPVLQFAALGQALFAGRLYAHEHRLEPGLHHHGHQLVVVAQIDGGLGGQDEWVPVLAHPLDKGRQNLPFELGLVAYKIVVNDEQVAPPARGVKVSKLSQNLCGAFGAHLAAEQGGYVAKLALVGASS